MSRAITMITSSYQDLAGSEWDLRTLSAAERRLVQATLRQAQRGTDWPKLRNSWHQQLLRLHPGRPGRDLVRLPVYAICEDITSRVGIDQGYFRSVTIATTSSKSSTNRSRPAIASQRARVWTRPSFLSRVMRKQAHLSIDTLDKVVAALGYRVALMRCEAVAQAPRTASSGRRQLQVAATSGRRTTVQVKCHASRRHTTRWSQDGRRRRLRSGRGAAE